jgi:hypothetical protein
MVVLRSLIYGLVALTFAAPAAGAAPVASLTGGQISVAVGRVVTVTVNLDGARACALETGGRYDRGSLRSVRGATKISFSWPVSKRTAPGRYKVRVLCDQTVLAQTVLVKAPPARNVKRVKQINTSPIRVAVVKAAVAPVTDADTSAAPAVPAPGTTNMGPPGAISPGGVVLTPFPMVGATPEQQAALDAMAAAINGQIGPAPKAG